MIFQNSSALSVMDLQVANVISHDAVRVLGMTK